MLRGCTKTPPHLVFDRLPADRNCCGGCDGGALCRCVSAYDAGKWLCDFLFGALCTVCVERYSASRSCPVVCPAPLAYICSVSISSAREAVARRPSLTRALTHLHLAGFVQGDVPSLGHHHALPAQYLPLPAKAQGPSPYDQPHSDPAPPAVYVATPSSFRKRFLAARYRWAVSNARKRWEHRAAALSLLAPQYAMYGRT